MTDSQADSDRYGPFFLINDLVWQNSGKNAKAMVRDHAFPSPVILSVSLSVSSFVFLCFRFSLSSTIKGGSRRAEKSRKVLMMMMMKAARLGRVGPGVGQEQGWSKASAGLSRVKQSRTERG